MMTLGGDIGIYLVDDDDDDEGNINITQVLPVLKVHAVNQNYVILW